MDVHVLDLVGTSGITRVLLVCVCQQGAYPRGHPTPLAPGAPIIKYIFYTVLNHTVTFLFVQDCMLNIDWSTKGMSYLKIVLL